MRAAAGGLLLACACNYAAAFVPPTLTFNLRRSAHAPAVQSQAAGRSPKCGTITRTLRCEHRSVHIAQPKEKVSGKDSFWDWKNGWQVHYTESGTDGPPLLLLTGFGVGGFHYDRNVEELSKTHRVWTMDVLGQGKSWPSNDPAPGGGFTEAGFQWGFGSECDPRTDSANLNYSCSMWAEQVIGFLETVVRQGPVYVVGNSLGGYLAVMLASQRPDLVKGLFLMNPTPFWGVGVQRILPWTGGYPVPTWVRPLTIAWWDTIRSPNTISSILGGVYANKERVGETLIAQIIEPTESPAAASAFASILCSPSSPRPFSLMLSDIRESGLPVALAYGKEDPWIVPMWGFRAKRSLPAAKYWEISPAGHCPHHECPEAINFLLKEWVAATEAGNSAALDFLIPRTITRDDAFGVAADAGKGFSVVEVEGAPRSLAEHLDQFFFQLHSAK